MEITPSSTPLAERILGLAEGLRAVPTDGLFDELVKLTMLCLFLTLGLLAGLYEKGLLRAVAPVPATTASPKQARQRGSVATGPFATEAASRRCGVAGFGPAGEAEAVEATAGGPENDGACEANVAPGAAEPGVAGDGVQGLGPVPHPGMAAGRPRPIYGGRFAPARLRSSRLRPDKPMPNSLRHRN